MLDRREEWVDCPYCGESIGVLLDPSELGQCYVEDCQVCCAPILFSLSGDDQSMTVTVRREDE